MTETIRNGIAGVTASIGGVLMTLTDIECALRIVGCLVGIGVGLLTCVNLMRQLKRKA